MENNINNICVPASLPTESVAAKALNEMAANMKKKWMKYYGGFQEVNHMVIIGLVLDARFKLKNVIHTFHQEDLSELEVLRRTNEIKDLIFALYDQYVLVVDEARHLQKQQTPSFLASTGSSRSSNSRRTNMLSSWKKLVQETDDTVAKHEVDQYLEAALEEIDDSDCFDILLWWKLNGCKYPVLAAVARDILSIQVSTVASESCFSTGCRVIDCFRSSLTPKTAEELICTQNWLLGDDIIEIIDNCTIENLSFYQSVEEEHESIATSKVNTCPPPPPRRAKV